MNSLPDRAQSAGPAGLPDAGVCAHRGDVEHAPESTLPALLMAVDKGAHMLEFDVWMTADGALVVMHDATVDRTTDGTGTLTNMTLAQVKALDAGAYFGERFHGTRVPTLEEVLEAPIPRDLWLNVHTRDHGPRDEEYMERLLAALEDTGRAAQTCLACFLPQADLARRRLPQVSICNMTRQADAGSDYPKLTVEAGAEFIQLVGATDQVPEAVKFLHEHGVKVNYFKADDPESLRWLLEQGVDFVLTDRLDIGLAVWREFSSA